MRTVTGAAARPAALFLTALFLAGCTRPAPSGSTSPSKTTLDQFASQTVNDYRGAVIKLTPLPANSGYAEPVRSVFALLVTTQATGSGVSALKNYHTHGIDYFNETWGVRELVLGPGRIQEFIDAVRKDSSRWQQTPGPHPAISITFFRPGTGGQPVVSEIFVEQKHAEAIAAKLTDTSFGTSGFETALHWEDNIW